MLKKYLEYRAKRIQIQQSIRELSSLTDKELNDIGITRYDIPRVVAEGANYGEEKSYRKAAKVSRSPV